MSSPQRLFQLWLLLAGLWLAGIGVASFLRWPAGLPVVPEPPTVRVTPADMDAFWLWLRVGAPSRTRINEHIRDYTIYAFVPPLAFLALGAAILAMAGGGARTCPRDPREEVNAGSDAGAHSPER